MLDRGEAAPALDKPAPGVAGADVPAAGAAAPPVIPGAGVAGPAGGADPVAPGAPVDEARLYSSCTYPGPDPAGLMTALSTLTLPEAPASADAVPAGSGPTGAGTADAGPAPAPNAAGGIDPEAPQHAGLVRHDTLAPLPYVEREWGDGSYPPLYCPPTVRIDDELAAEVNRRLVTWAEKVGIHAGRMDKFRETGFGRLAMLTHSDTDDPDRLLVAAQMNAAWWAADDYYADETPLGATPTELPPRLALVMSAMDPPPAAGKYTAQLEEAIAADPVLVALNSATAHLSRHATPAQVMRACNTTFQMYVSWTAYAAWRYLGELPPVWRYLAARQHDSFYTSMTLIDIVAGYHLPANLFYDRRFHRALMQAGTAAVLVNDLHSVAREAADEMPDSNVVLLIAAEDNCSIREATLKTVALHNDFVCGFEVSQRQLASVPSLEMQRFLRGAQAWLGGCLEWHATSSRYQ